jgi:uncharacterized membrane protein
MDMFWDRHHDIAGWWPMGISLVIGVILIGMLVWLTLRALSHGSGPGGQSADELLRRRFAAGEIDEEEYTKRAEVLRRR